MFLQDLFENYYVNLGIAVNNLVLLRLAGTGESLRTRAILCSVQIHVFMTPDSNFDTNKNRYLTIKALFSNIHSNLVMKK